MSLKSPRDCRRKAAECLVKAQKVRDENIKADWLSLSRSWGALADTTGTVTERRYIPPEDTKDL